MYFMCSSRKTIVLYQRHWYCVFLRINNFQSCFKRKEKRKKEDTLWLINVYPMERVTSVHFGCKKLQRRCKGETEERKEGKRKGRKREEKVEMTQHKQGHETQEMNGSQRRAFEKGKYLKTCLSGDTTQCDCCRAPGQRHSVSTIPRKAKRKHVSVMCLPCPFVSFFIISLHHNLIFPDTQD